MTMLILTTAAARADDFGALPGLWKTTLQVTPSTGNEKSPQPAAEWHCVDEDADPWIEFARLPEQAVDSCQRTSFERTATSLKWQFSCSAPGPITSIGSIVFDSPQHYSGTITFIGTVLNVPLRSVTSIEGQRLAACTSPKD